VTETGGEPNTRLERLESDISETKERLSSLENELQIVKQGASAMQSQLLGQDDKLDRILVWVDGANKVAGVATRHWKTALKFGCGVVTAWGISNPQVAHVVAFVGKFFGL
jgi:acetyl-CoA carboxylase carboxyltransferase component